MRFRFLLRVLITSFLAYSLFIVAPRYANEKCAKLELQTSAPCTAFLAAQSKIHLNAANSWTAVKSHKYAKVVSDKYHASGLDPHIRREYNRVNNYWTVKARPVISEVSKRATKLAIQHSKQASTRTIDFVQNKGWPVCKEKSVSLRNWTYKQLVLLWHKVESSKLWEDVIVPQAKNIYETIAHRTTQAKEGSVDKTNENAEALKEEASQKIADASSAASASASSSAAAAVSASASSASASSASTSSASASASSSSAAAASSSSAAAASSSSSSAASASSSSLAASVSAASASSASVAAESAASQSLSAASASSASSVSSSATEATEATESASSKPAVETVEPTSWLQRVQKNVDYAIGNLEEDSREYLQTSVNEAKPDIMGVLRQIALYGEDAVKEYTAIVKKVESDSSDSENISKREVYDTYDKHLKTMADMAYKVRDRAERLAHESLEGLDPVRLVTLDALDDYFDVVLTEAAREMTAKDDWNGWKEYHQLKQALKNLRATVESHEFDMEIVNTALRESQTASIILVQQYNQKLTDMRAQCQMIFQQRESFSEPKEDEQESSENANEENADEVFSESEELNPEDVAQSASSYRENNTNIEEQPVDFEADVEVPFNNDIDFEDFDEIETIWETRQVTQTAA